MVLTFIGYTGGVQFSPPPFLFEFSNSATAAVIFYFCYSVLQFCRCLALLCTPLVRSSQHDNYGCFSVCLMWFLVQFRTPQMAYEGYTNKFGHILFQFVYMYIYSIKMRRPGEVFRNLDHGKGAGKREPLSLGYCEFCASLLTASLVVCMKYVVCIFCLGILDIFVVSTLS